MHALPGAERLPNPFSPSQDSSHSTGSSIPSIPGRLQTSLSNLSQSSNASLLDSATSTSHSQGSGASHQSFSLPASQGSAKEHIWSRPHTPGSATQVPKRGRGDSAGSTTSSGVPESPTHGSKRMADGIVKSEGSAIASSPRNMRSLSAQLRSRLSYAAVKVQNGWETRSLSDLEPLTSQLTSPHPRDPTKTPSSASSLSNSNNKLPPLAPSANNLANVKNHSNNLSKAVDRSEHPTPIPRTSTSTPSAWRHSNTTAPSLRTEPKLRPAPLLAPAPDLTPSPSRRTNTARRSNRTPYHQPPHMPSRGDDTGAAGTRHGHAAEFGASMTPTEQEKDAVDTLLFMSSPANSAAYAAGVSPAARKGQGIAGGRRGRKVDGNYDDDDDDDRGGGKMPGDEGWGFKSKADVDSFLDGMQDCSGDEKVTVTSNGRVGGGGGGRKGVVVQESPGRSSYLRK